LKAIHMRLAALAPAVTEKPSLFVADVTSSITDSRSGFKYISFITSLELGHNVKVNIVTPMES